MSEARFQRIVDAWIAAQDLEQDAPEYDPSNWAIQLVIRWHTRYKPKQLWRLIVAVLERDVSEEVLGMIAAGPLEDLLSDWGQDYIERVEELARTNEKFRHLLRGVYGWTQMPKDVWIRLQSLIPEADRVKYSTELDGKCTIGRYQTIAIMRRANSGRHNFLSMLAPARAGMHAGISSIVRAKNCGASRNANRAGQRQDPR